MFTAKFTGKFMRTMDAKNRIVMPPPFKSVFNGGPFYLISLPIDRGKCLRIYDEEGIEEIMNSSVYVEREGCSNSNFQRLFFGNMTKYYELDVQSRFTVLPEKLEFAGIKKEVAIVGMGQRIELWDPENYHNTVEVGFTNEQYETFDPKF